MVVWKRYSVLKYSEHIFIIDHTLKQSASCWSISTSLSAMSDVSIVEGTLVKQR